MLSKTFTALLAALAVGFGHAEPVRKRQPCHHGLEEFIDEQAEISIAGVLANIGADGSNAAGVPPGVVVASPSRADPDYWFTWTRDSALTYKALVERFIAGDTSLRSKLDEYVAAQAILQGVSNPSGAPSGGGLGEPKFHVNLTEFTGPWGRPQRDGPPLRATALILYANWLVANGGRDQVVQDVWPVIAKDLSYTVRYWNQTGYDLWEETNGSSFFTLSAAYRALVEGAALAEELGQECEGCADSAPDVLCFTQSFWVGSYIDSNINVNEGRTGKDANSILSSMHTFDPEAECTDSTFQPCSARALSNHKAVVDSFRSIYTINDGIPQGRAVAVGRYAEDVYYNGNPWYLTTLAAAEQLYSAIYQWEQHGSITITELSLSFFSDILTDIAVGTYAEGTATYTSILSAVRTYADDFIAVVQKYTPEDGALAEQYNRDTGIPLSARDLTWSYAAFLTTIERREGIVPPGWGETGANTVPAVCKGTPACDSRTTFNLRVVTQPGEQVLIVGSLTQLGNWSPASGVALDASEYTQDDPLWFVQVDLPAETIFEYKYIKRLSDGQIVWESDPNRRYTSSAGCGSSGTSDDEWR